MPKLLHWLKEFRSKLQLLRHKSLCSQYSGFAASLMQYNVCYRLTCKGIHFVLQLLACSLYVEAQKLQTFCPISTGWIYGFLLLQEEGETQDGRVVEEGQNAWSG